MSSSSQQPSENQENEMFEEPIEALVIEFIPHTMYYCCGDSLIELAREFTTEDESRDEGKLFLSRSHKVFKHVNDVPHDMTQVRFVVGINTEMFGVFQEPITKGFVFTRTRDDGDEYHEIKTQMWDRISGLMRFLHTSHDVICIKHDWKISIEVYEKVES